jgi:hypothetical protein
VRRFNEGTADNYFFFHNELNAEMFEGNDICFCGTYGYRSWNISSKQRSIEVFHESTWG